MRLLILVVCLTASLLPVCGQTKSGLAPRVITSLAENVCTCLSRTTANPDSLAIAVRGCTRTVLTDNLPFLFQQGYLPTAKVTQELERQMGVDISASLLQTCPVYIRLVNDRPGSRAVVRADSLRQAGQYAKALAIFRPVFAQLPLDKSVFNSRGLCRLELGDYSGALADFEYALERDSANAVFFNNRGLAKDRLGLNQAALTDFDRAIRLDSTNATFYLNRGVLYYDNEVWDDALTDLEQVVRRDSTMADAFYYLGQIHQHERDFPRAELYLNRAIGLESRNAVYHNTRGLLYLATKAPAQARADFETAIRCNATYNPAYFNLAVMLADQKRHGEAIALFDKAIAISPDLSLYHHHRAKSLLALARYTDALEATNRAIELADNKAEYYDQRAEIYEKRGRYADALNDYTTSLELDGTDGTIFYRRALVRIILKDKPGTCADLRMSQYYSYQPATKALTTYCR
jgi:tetratricopeptide (TPR) repeat protein